MRCCVLHDRRGALTKEIRERLFADPDWRYRGRSNRPSKREIAYALLEACLKQGMSEALKQQTAARLAECGFDGSAALYALDRLGIPPGEPLTEG